MCAIEYTTDPTNGNVLLSDVQTALTLNAIAIPITRIPAAGIFTF